MHLVVTGHVDHGKSTIIGRLLADTGSLPEGKLEAVRATCQRHAKPFEYAFLLDALKDEQAQGITIDSARVSSRRRGGTTSFAARVGQPRPHVSTRVKVSVFWLGRSPLVLGDQYVLKLVTARVPFASSRFTGSSMPQRRTAQDAKGGWNEAECTLETLRKRRLHVRLQSPREKPDHRLECVDGEFVLAVGLVNHQILLRLQTRVRRTNVLHEPVNSFLRHADIALWRP